MHFLLLLLHIAEILASILVINTAARRDPVSEAIQDFAGSVLSKLTCFTCCNSKTSLGYQSVRETTPTETNKRPPVESPNSISLTDSTCSLDKRPLMFTWIDIASMLDRLFFMVFVFLRVLILAVCLGANSILCGSPFCVS